MLSRRQASGLPPLEARLVVALAYADLERIKAEFELIGSNPELIAQAQLWDGKTELDPVARYLEQAAAVEVGTFMKAPNGADTRKPLVSQGVVDETAGHPQQAAVDIESEFPGVGKNKFAGLAQLGKFVDLEFSGERAEDLEHAYRTAAHMAGARRALEKAGIGMQ